MITFSGPITESKEHNQPFSEGMIGDVMKAAADVDADKIKKEWEAIDKNSDPNKLGQKARVLNDQGIGKAADAVEGIDKALGKQRANTSSIIARARQSVLQFPIYVTQTLRVNEAQIIAKLFERVYTTLVQTVLSQNPIIDEEQANNLVFLKQFHTNLRESGDLFINEYYEPIDELDQMMKESVFYSEAITPTMSVEFRWIPSTNVDLIKENARLLNEPLMGLAYLKEDKEETTVKKTQNQYTTVTEKELEEMARDKAGLSEREWKTIDMSARDIKAEVEASIPGDEKDPHRQRKVREAVDRRLKQKHDAEEKFKRSLDELKNNIKAGKVPGYSYDGVRYRREDKKGELSTTKRDKDKRAPDVIKGPDAPKMLRDADIKKINGMLPYTIEATFRLRSKNGGLDQDVRFIIGIKSVMHLIRTQDLADDLRDLVTGNIKSLQKVRYKTGEIGFLDYMFNIKGIKADAAKHVNYNKRWLNTLKRLGEYEKMNGSLLKNPIKAITNGDVPIANATLILAQTDVTTLTNQTGIDLSIVSNAKRLAKTLFLIGIVIVDSSAGTMRVLFPDSDTDWDVQSLASIDAELAKTDNSQLMKELNHLVNR